MSRKGLSRQTRKQIEKLHAQLKSAEVALSENNQQLSSKTSHAIKDDENMFPIVISDVLRGLDISTRYPAFFQKLLVNENLRSAFLEDVDILLKSKTGELESLPARPSRDLEFLHGVPPAHTIELATSGKWRITWNQVAEQLQHIFLSPALSSEGVYRDASHDQQDIPFRLFRSQVDLYGERVTAILEALQPLAKPDVLQPAFVVAADRDLAEERDFPDLLARLEWGDYDETVRVSNKGKAVFPDLPLAIILDQGKAKIAWNLRLTLEANP